MSVHSLKLVHPFFEHVWSGLKDFEVRKNDRNFSVGDTLILTEVSSNTSYVPRSVYMKIKYILYGGSFGVSPDYVVLCLTRISQL